MNKIDQKLDAEMASPELVVRSTPHLQVLGLIPIPERCEVGLVPNINDQSSSHAIGLDVGEQLSKVCIPTSPISIVSGVGSSRVLSSIGAPEIVNKENERCTILARGLII